MQTVSLVEGFGTPHQKKGGVLGMTQKYLMVRLRFLRSAKWSVPLQYHYSLVHMGSEIYYLFGSHLSVKRFKNYLYSIVPYAKKGCLGYDTKLHLVVRLSLSLLSLFLFLSLSFSFSLSLSGAWRSSEYFFIAIILRSTLTRSGSTC